MNAVSSIQNIFDQKEQLGDILLAVKEKFPNHREADSTKPVEVADGTLLQRHVRHLLSFTDETGKVVVFGTLFFCAHIEMGDQRKFIERIEKFEQHPNEVIFVFNSLNQLDPLTFDDFKEYKVIKERGSLYLLQKKIFVPVPVPAVVPVPVPAPEVISEKSSWTARKIALLALGVGLGAVVALSILHRLRLPLLLKAENEISALFNRLVAIIS